jgi:hypothetical protein
MLGIDYIQYNEYNEYIEYIISTLIEANDI